MLKRTVSALLLCGFGLPGLAENGAPPAGGSPRHDAGDTLRSGLASGPEIDFRLTASRRPATTSASTDFLSASFAEVAAKWSSASKDSTADSRFIPAGYSDVKPAPFRVEAGRHSDQFSGRVSEKVGVFVWVSPSGIKSLVDQTGEADAGQERTDHATDTTKATACP